jgi:hypothetical protein
MLSFGSARVTAVKHFQEQYAEYVGAILRKLRQNIAGQAERTRENKVRWVLGTIWWVVLSSLSLDGQLVEIEDLATDVAYHLVADNIKEVEAPDICRTEALYQKVSLYVCADCGKHESSGWPALENVTRLGVTERSVARSVGTSQLSTLAEVGTDTGRPNKSTAQLYLVSTVGGGRQTKGAKKVKKPRTVEQRDAVLDRGAARDEVARCESREYLKAEVVVLNELNVALTMERDRLSNELKAVKAESERRVIALRQSDAGREAAIKEVESRCALAHKRERQRDRLSIEGLKTTAAEHERERNRWRERVKTLRRAWASQHQEMQLKLTGLERVKESYKVDVKRLRAEVGALSNSKKQRVGEGGKSKVTVTRTEDSSNI